MSEYDIRRLLPRLHAIVGKRYVLTRPEELAVYECDGCLLVKSPPEAVVLPRTTDEVAAIVRLCIEQGIPYTARGSGTGLSGGALPLEGGVLISLNRMDTILEIDTQNEIATVEVGVINGWLNQALQDTAYFYAPDPSSQSACTLGGNIAENAGGIHCIKYGVTTDHVLALEVVLPDGTVTWLGSRNRRSHGLNLVGLMVGSEGTLGIVTRAVVRIVPKPAEIRAYLAAFETVEDAGSTVSAIIASGLVPAALEFMDTFTVKAVNAAYNVGFPETSEAVLLIEIDGDGVEVPLAEKVLMGFLESNRACQIRSAETAEERQQLWAARKGAVAAYGRYLPAFYLHDTVIPRSELTAVLRQIQAIARKYDITVGNVFHAGDGNLHPNILFDPADPDMVERILKGGAEILKACLDAGGTLSGEHGIGIEKSEYMPLIFSEADLARMMAIKEVFDPRKLANPLKIFPVRKGCGETKMAVDHPLLASGGAWI